MHLTEQERNSLVELVAQAESLTGAQLVTVVVGKSDSYDEAPWKAFALGAALAALAVAVALPRGWEVAVSTAHAAAIILGFGAAMALLTALLPWFARLFIERERREIEVAQFARSMFSSRGLGRTRGRLGVLILISLLERRATIVADDGFDGRVSPEDWQQVVARMTFLLRRRRPAGALRSGVQALQALLLEHGFLGPEELADLLPNAPIEMEEFQ